MSLRFLETLRKGCGALVIIALIGVLLVVFPVVGTTGSDVLEYQLVTSWRDGGGGIELISIDGPRNLCYVASGSGFRILDISDPTNLKQIASVFGKVGSIITDLFFENEFLFLVTEKGLQIWDTSTPSVPQRVGVYSTRLSRGFVVGSVAYVTDDGCPGGLRILDISDPTNPRDVGFWEAPTGNGPRPCLGQVFVEDSLAFVTCYSRTTWERSALWIVDVSNPAKPHTVGTYDFTEVIEDIFVSGNHVYVAAGEAGLRILDSSDPSNPVEVGSWSEPGCYVKDLFVSESNVYVATQGILGFSVIDVSDPVQPKRKASHDVMAVPLGIASFDAKIYVTTFFEGLQVYEAVSPAAEFIPVRAEIAFVSDRSGIFVADSSGENLQNLTNTRVDGQPTWSPDGREIAFTSLREGVLKRQLYVMNADGSNVRRLTTLDRHVGSPTWSPDGGKIAFIADFNVYVVNRDGTSIQNLAPGYDLTWAPEGRKIAFKSNKLSSGLTDIWCINVDGTGLQNLTNDPGAYDFVPSWSSDGTKIAFVSYRDGDYEIYVMNADGTKQRNLTNHRASDYEPNRNWGPMWSPDGTKIAFVSNRDGNWEIYVMNADGSDVRRITDHPASDGDPYWSPDGKLIAFVSERYGLEKILIVNVETARYWCLSNIYLGREGSPTWSPPLD
ncbi:PD40 domain-containing protein [Candidatus Bipolaricaulota bacterium]|nr:PD40 domain-containing protein [Candidatus Bipolaricaulota bacterium]